MLLPPSWVFPGTNYCGWTKSGPGSTTSRNDVCCQQHDSSIRNAKTSCINFFSYKILDAHDELVDCLERNNE